VWAWLLVWPCGVGGSPGPMDAHQHTAHSLNLKQCAGHCYHHCRATDSWYCYSCELLLDVQDRVCWCDMRGGVPWTAVLGVRRRLLPVRKQLRVSAWS
jgi:hypothetical protein